MTYVEILKFDTRQSRHPAGTPQGGQWMKGGSSTTSSAPLSPQSVYIAALSPAERARIDATNAKLRVMNEANEAAKAAARQAEAEAKSGPPDRGLAGEPVNSLIQPVSKHSSSSHPLGGGINVSVVVEIEGKEYVFKPIDGEAKMHEAAYDNTPLAEREVLASRLDRELGLGLTPPTVMGEVDGRRGSLQEFIADANTWGSVPNEHDSVSREELATMAVFDMLLANTDRHSGNAMIKDGKLYAIDHGFTMREEFHIKNVYPLNGGPSEGDMPVQRQHELAERIADMNVGRVFEGSHWSKLEKDAFLARQKQVVKVLRQGNIHLYQLIK